MSDDDLILDIISSILTAIQRVERRFIGIHSVDDFTNSDEGIDRLDGIAMMLIAIGEQIKRLDRYTATELTELEPGIDWRGVKGIRDVLSHHYFDLDAEIIFDVCANKIRPLKLAVERLQKKYGN